MTTIVVAQQDGVISIGCDGLSNAGGFIVDRQAQKWILGTDCALGVAGESVLQAEAERKNAFAGGPLLGASPSPEELVDRLRAIWGRVDFTPKKDEDGGVPWRLFNGIYVRREQVWYIDSSLGWAEQRGDWAQGSGRGYALGALYCCKGDPPVIRVLNALFAAQRYDVNTGGVMQVWTLGDEGWKREEI